VWPGHRHEPETVAPAKAGSTRGRLYLSAQYRRLAARRGKKRALVALGHTLLVIIYTFADGEPACTISHIGHMGTYSIRKDSDARTHDIDCPNC